MNIILYGRKNSNYISFKITQPILRGGGIYTKSIEIIVKSQFLIFATGILLFFFFVNVGPNGCKSFKLHIL